MASETKLDCPFCSADIESKIIEKFGTVIAIEDKTPVTKGHILIIPVRHTQDFFSMTNEEKKDTDNLIQLMQEKIKKADPTVTGFNIGVNCGKSAGQSIMHTHIHLIPRRDGDTTEPKGGVRGVIPDKMGY
ncbi:MAG: HIT family protein [Sedimentisphaerales bacterium]|nr:HIT family protein [Sedimentisphaerales bacterium]